jgi:YD repeat-containing protein
VICVYDAAGNLIETHEQAGGFREFELRTMHA